VPLAVCSWTLTPDSPATLVERITATGLPAVQLALDPLRGDWDPVETDQRLTDAGIELVSGMMAMAGEDYSTLEAIAVTGGVRPDGTWAENRRAAQQNARLAAQLGLPLVTFHAGFIPHDEGAERTTMLGRLREMVDIFAAEGVRVAFETGQETAGTLLAALDALDRPEAGVNSDPANMILYGMGDPIDAVGALAARIAQVHIKDATATAVPGTWGAEVPVGEGEVEWPRFLAAVRALDREVDLVVEREAGERRVEDIRTARTVVESTLASLEEEAR